MSEINNEPRPASTVILVRPNDETPQVYLLRRSPNSGFMPGNYVFPGGTVGSSDGDVGFWVSHSDMARQEISRRFGANLPLEKAVAHTVAAIRETFEEAGVILASQGKFERKNSNETCESHGRRGFHEGWFKEWVASEGKTMAFSDLSPWSHWITPVTRRLRYDTRFFLAAMPEGQICRPDTRETTRGIWICPEEGLAANNRGEMALSPPTLVTLNELLPFKGVKFMKRESEGRSWGEARIPRLIMSDLGALLLLPWDPLYSEKTGVGPEILKRVFLEPGEPFSRLFYRDGIWRPIASS